MTSTPRAHSLVRGGRRRNAAPPDSGCATWWQVLEIAGNRGAICVGQPARAVLDHLAHGIAEEVAVGGHAAFHRIGDVGVVPVGQAAGSGREVRHLAAVGAPGIAGQRLLLVDGAEPAARPATGSASRRDSVGPYL